MRIGRLCRSQNLALDYKIFVSMKNIIERICNKIVRHTKWYDQYWNGVQKFWYLNHFNLDVVNLGSNSGKYAFCYDGLNVAGMNWAVGPQSLVHDFNILKNYYSYLGTGAVVLISLCPFSSLVSHYTKNSNLKYYTFLHPATILDFEEKERLKALKIKQSPIREMPLYCVKSTIKELARVFIHRPVRRCDMEKSAVMFVEAWKKQFDIKDLNAPLSEQHSNDQENRIQVLKEMIGFCLEMDLKPVLVIPPMHPSLRKKLTAQCRENYIYSFIRKANEQNVLFLNYMDDERFDKDEYYRNAFMMSEKGAKLFTGIILETLNC